MAVGTDACAPAAASVVMALGTGSARSSSAPVSRCFTVLLVFDGALDRVGSKPDPVGEVFSMRLKNLEREFRDAHRDEMQVIAHLRAPLSAANPTGLAGADSPTATGGRHGLHSCCIAGLGVRQWELLWVPRPKLPLPRARDWLVIRPLANCPSSDGRREQTSQLRIGFDSEGGFHFALCHPHGLSLDL